ncbi:MAG: aminotransferase class III-fold pyridoxal phosphate-dependent enzyme [Bdellovibrionales bacterium]|nr:aminotransferase class III-fold pyridoxal phosphate-dependent enzyme [Bdellovibrionales bacterium]
MSSSLIGHDLYASPEVKKHIEALVAEVSNNNSRIQGIKGPDSEMSAKLDEVAEEINATRGRPLFFKYVGSGIGKGSYVELIDGSVKLDLINGIGINIMGHSHPEVMKASLRGAMSDVVMQGNLEPNHEYLDLAKKLVELASRGSRLRHCWVTTSGSMANENALKISRQKNTPARKIMALESAFAGRTTMMAEITDNPNNRVGLPTYDEVLRVPYCNKFSDMCQSSCGKDRAVTKMKELIDQNKGDISAFVFEPMLGEGGYRVACREYFTPLLELCKENGIAIWADEIQTFARTGNFFAYDTLGFGEYVDIVTVAKTVQNAATLYTEEYNPKPGLIAGTFAGSSSSMAAGVKILDILDKDGYMGPDGKIQKIHDEFIGMLNRLNETTCKGLLTDAGGLGLMVAVTPLDGSKDKMLALLHKMFENGVMAFGCGKGPFRLRFLLPAVMTSEDIEAAGKAIEKSVLELA